MNSNSTTRAGSLQDVWPGYQSQNTSVPQLVPAHLQPVQLVPSQFPIPSIVLPQHISQNPEDPRLLDEETSSQFRGLIDNRGDCVALQAQCFAQRRRNHELEQDPDDDPDGNFPADDPAHQKMLVGQIFLAIRNKTGLLNGQAVRDGQGELSIYESGNVLRRPDGNTKRVDEMTDVKVEILLWDILYGIKDAHEGSLFATEWTWDYSFKYERHETFKARFVKVLELLRVSKRVICDLLEASWLCRITKAPGWELERKRRTKNLNARKSKVLRESTKRTGSRASVNDDENNDENNDAENGDVSDEEVAEEPREARPKKRRRIGGTATARSSSASVEARLLPGTIQQDPRSTGPPLTSQVLDDARPSPTPLSGVPPEPAAQVFSSV